MESRFNQISVRSPSTSTCSIPADRDIQAASQVAKAFALVRNNENDLVDAMFQAGLPAGVHDPWGNTLLHAAARAGTLNAAKVVVQWAVSRGERGSQTNQEQPFINILNREGQTALTVARKVGNKELAEWLVQQGATEVDPRQQDPEEYRDMMRKYLALPEPEQDDRRSAPLSLPQAQPSGRSTLRPAERRSTPQQQQQQSSMTPLPPRPHAMTGTPASSSSSARGPSSMPPKPSSASSLRNQLPTPSPHHPHSSHSHSHSTSQSSPSGGLSSRVKSSRVYLQSNGDMNGHESGSGREREKERERERETRAPIVDPTPPSRWTPSYEKEEVAEGGSGGGRMVNGGGGSSSGLSLMRLRDRDGDEEDQDLDLEDCLADLVFAPGRTPMEKKQGAQVIRQVREVMDEVTGLREDLARTHGGGFNERDSQDSVTVAKQKSELHTLTMASRRLEADLKHSERRLQNSEERVQDLESELESQHREHLQKLEEMEEKIRAAKTHHQHMSSRELKRASEAAHKKTALELEEAQQRIQQLHAQIESNEVELEDQHRMHLRKVEALEKERTDLKRQYDTLKKNSTADIKEAQAQIERLRVQERERQEEWELSQANLKTMHQTALELADEKCLKAQHLYDTLHEEQEAMRQKHFQAEEESRKKEREQWMRENDELREEATRMRGELEQMKVENLQDRQRDHFTTTLSYVQSQGQLEVELSQITEENRQLRFVIQGLEEKLLEESRERYTAGFTRGFASGCHTRHQEDVRAAAAFALENDEELQRGLVDHVNVHHKGRRRDRDHMYNHI